MNVVNISSNFIGKIVIAKTPFFDARSKKMKIKARPMLIIGAEKEYLPCDYNVLPVSRITNRRHRHNDYDLEINSAQCEVLSLNYEPSFVRTHKQTVVNSRDVVIEPISDFKELEKELYQEVVDIYTKFTKELF